LTALLAPFPYFGGKRSIASEVWSKRTALICDRIDEWFGLAPMRQRNRRPRAADPKQTALQLELVA
jgi:hypothetical protein